MFSFWLLEEKISFSFELGMNLIANLRISIIRSFIEFSYFDEFSVSPISFIKNA